MTRTVTLAGYLVLAAASVAVEIAARWPGRTGGVATLSSLLAAALRRPVVRALAMAAWLWLGWHLFVRVDWR